MALVNNGLPEGIHFKDIKVGDIIEIQWDDAPNELVVVLHSDDLNKQKTYKGHVSIYVMRPNDTHSCHIHSIEGDQVVRLTCRNVFDNIVRP